MTRSTSTEKSYQLPETYYWANAKLDEIGAAVRHQFELYQTRITASGVKGVWQRAFLAHHGRNPDGGYANSHVITFGGEDGENAQIHLGHFRRHIKGRKQMSTGQRPAFEVTARNNDPASLAAVKVAKQVFEYDLAEQNLEQDLNATHERAVLYSEGYFVQTWDVRSGELLTVEPVDPAAVDTAERGIPELDGAEKGTDPIVMREVRAGSIRGLVRSPNDVARDLSRDEIKNAPWFIVRDRVHRWELARHYPESREARKKILNAPSAESADDLLFGATKDGETSSDYVERLTLYHMPTDALPNGRIVEVIEQYALPGTDQEYASWYGHCVVHADIPSPELDEATGYCDNWDLLAPTQALDAIETTILSLADAGSLVNWAAPKGAGVKLQDLRGKLQLVEWDDDEGRYSAPTVMERPRPEESDFKASAHYLSHMRVLSGQNAVVQGDPEANIKSGNFAALVASMAVTAANDEVGAYGHLMRSVMNGRLELYQRFLDHERTIDITGKDNASHVLVFKKDHLDGAARVKVEVGSPMTRTIQGKVDLASKLFEMYPQQVTLPMFMGLMHTGRIDDLEPTSTDDDKIGARTENDLFVSGKGRLVTVLKTDHHVIHILEHRKQANDPAFRYSEDPSPERVQALGELLEHISEHSLLWDTTAQTEPGLLMATGQAPPPQKMPPSGAPPEGPEGPPNGSVGSMPPGGGNPAAGDPMMPPGTPDNIDLPSAAKNPLKPDEAPVPGMGMPGRQQAQG